MVWPIAGGENDAMACTRFCTLLSSSVFPDFIVLQVAAATSCRGSEFVVSQALNRVHPDLRASNPLSGLVEVECDVRSIKLPDADALLGTVPAAVYRMVISASKKSTIRRKSKQVLSYAACTVGGGDPCTDNASISFVSALRSDSRPRRRAPGKASDKDQAR